MPDGYCPNLTLLTYCPDTLANAMNPTREPSSGLVTQGLSQPLKLSHFKLAAFDMDSTLINIECVDEIADAAGRKAEVAAITEAAMRGEITDYKDSLRRRVALLKGVPVAAMQEVLTQRMQLNPGALALTQAFKAAGMKLLLVSGGFTFFTDVIRDRLQMDYARSNVLEVANGLLTGRMVDQPWGDICDGAEKRKMLLETCAELGIDAKQAIAVGDGANDLPMMGVAGLSVAYHAKPKVREQAMVAINSGGLDRVLELF
jgi:phosphoserine phosphatase